MVNLFMSVIIDSCVLKTLSHQILEKKLYQVRILVEDIYINVSS